MQTLKDGCPSRLVLLFPLPAFSQATCSHAKQDQLYLGLHRSPPARGARQISQAGFSLRRTSKVIYPRRGSLLHHSQPGQTLQLRSGGPNFQRCPGAAPGCCGTHADTREGFSPEPPILAPAIVLTCLPSPSAARGAGSVQKSLAKFSYFYPL